MQSDKETLNESLLSYAVDLSTAFRIVKILYQDWTSTKAFKLGIIDENGNKLKNPSGLDEKSAYSPFIRLVFRLKKLLAMVPGGSTKLGSLAAAYAMLRENEETIDINRLSKEDIDHLFEDAPVNVAGGVAGHDKPIGIVRRNWQDMEKFGGANVFDVDPCTYSKCTAAKQKYERWDRYVSDEDGEVGQDILKFAKTYPGKGIVLREKGTNAMVYLKAPK